MYSRRKTNYSLIWQSCRCRLLQNSSRGRQGEPYIILADDISFEADDILMQTLICWVRRITRLKAILLKVLNWGIFLWTFKDDTVFCSHLHETLLCIFFTHYIFTYYETLQMYTSKLNKVHFVCMQLHLKLAVSAMCCGHRKID